MTRSFGPHLKITVCALALVCAAAACTGGDDEPDASARSSTTVPAAPEVDESPPAVLERVSLQRADLAAPYHVALRPDGDKVGGEVTLDLCGLVYPSEARRRFRRQVEARGEDDATGVGTEAVLYDVPDGAAQAMKEIASAPDICSDDVADPEVEDAPIVRYEFGPPPDGTWPRVAGVERHAIDVTVTDPEDTVVHAVLTFLRRGRLLVGVYALLDDGTSSIAPSVGGVPELVNVIERRMAAVSDSFVSAGGERA